MDTQKILQEHYTRSGEILSMALQIESKFDLFITDYFILPKSVARKIN